MLEYAEILEILEAHDGMCLDNDAERGQVAAALYNYVTGGEIMPCKECGYTDPEGREVDCPNCTE